VNAALDAVFYRFGIWGIPLSTSVVNIAGTGALVVLLRRRMGTLGLTQAVRSAVLVTVASAVLAAVAWWVWYLVDGVVGRSLPGQLVSVGAGLALGIAAFLGACRLLGVDELNTMLRLRRARA
jgi:putative peptidoglycan lipid II flippase